MHLNFKKRNKKKPNLQLVWGFTMIELLVVITITGLLIGVMSVSFSSTRTTFRLFAEQVELENTIAKARSFGMEEFFENPEDLGDSTKSVVCGWGVHFETDRYFIYKDLLAEPGATNCRNSPLHDPAYSVLYDTEYEVHLLPDGVILDTTTPLPGEGQLMTDVTFNPPGFVEIVPPLPGRRAEGYVVLRSGDNIIPICVSSEGAINHFECPPPNSLP